MDEKIVWFSKKLKKKYKGIIDCCYNEKSKDYRFYGGKGITVCDDWIKNPQLFNDLAINNEYNDSFIIGRRDTNKGFSPNNCILTTAAEAAKWKSTTTRITVGDITDSGKGWARRLNLGINHINKYLKTNGIEKTVDYIKSILDGDFVFENKYKVNKITVNGITNSYRGWSAQLGLSKNTIQNYISKYGIDVIIKFIEKKLKNENTNIDYIRNLIRGDLEFIEQSKVKLWEIQKIVKCGEYKFAVVYNHPNATINGYVLLHRIIMENHIGRILNVNEVVHHKNFNKNDNRIENLELMSRSEHTKLHQQAKYHFEFEIKCPTCGKIFNRDIRSVKSKLKINPHKTFCCSHSCGSKLQNMIKKVGFKKLEDKIKFSFITLVKVFPNGNKKQFDK